MNNFYYNLIPEKRNTWRNAYEIKIAELEHEKRRYQMTDEGSSLSKPRTQAEGNRQSIWMSIIKVPQNLLTLLIN